MIKLVLIACPALINVRLVKKKVIYAIHVMGVCSKEKMNQNQTPALAYFNILMME